MRFYTGGNFYPQLPQVIHDLPIDLLRSRTYPRNPQVLEQGMRELQQDDKPVFYAPQRMAFSKWKTPPSPTGYGQNVISMLGALRAQFQIQQMAQPQGLPIMDAIQAGRAVGADRMPQPTDNLDQNLYQGYVPLARGAVPRDEMVDVDLLNQVALDASNPEDLRNDARAAALQSAEDIHDQLNSLPFSNTGVPWFMR